MGLKSLFGKIATAPFKAAHKVAKSVAKGPPGLPGFGKKKPGALMTFAQKKKEM